MGVYTEPSVINIEGATGNRNYDLSTYATLQALADAINADTENTGVTAGVSGTTLTLLSELPGASQFVKVTRNGVTFPVKVRAVDPPELVAVIVTLYEPPAEGVPDKRPAELRLRPLGRAPPVT
jgi:S1-C subfamily serine protease